MTIFSAKHELQLKIITSSPPPPKKSMRVHTYTRMEDNNEAKKESSKNKIPSFGFWWDLGAALLT